MDSRPVRCPWTSCPSLPATRVMAAARWAARRACLRAVAVLAAAALTAAATPFGSSASAASRASAGSRVVRNSPGGRPLRRYRSRIWSSAPMAFAVSPPSAGPSSLPAGLSGLPGVVGSARAASWAGVVRSSSSSCSAGCPGWSGASPGAGACSAATAASGTGPVAVRTIGTEVSGRPHGVFPSSTSAWSIDSRPFVTRVMCWLISSSLLSPRWVRPQDHSMSRWPKIS